MLTAGALGISEGQIGRSNQRVEQDCSARRISMEQLIQHITQPTGIEEAQAREAVQMVASYLKAQLPAPIAAQVDTVLGGRGGQHGTDQAANMLGSIGGMFGKK
jgi:hypothetical protein